MAFLKRFMCNLATNIAILLGFSDVIGLIIGLFAFLTHIFGPIGVVIGFIILIVISVTINNSLEG